MLNVLNFAVTAESAPAAFRLIQLPDAVIALAVGSGGNVGGCGGVVRRNDLVQGIPGSLVEAVVEFNPIGFPWLRTPSDCDGIVRGSCDAGQPQCGQAGHHDGKTLGVALNG